MKSLSVISFARLLMTLYDVDHHNSTATRVSYNVISKRAKDITDKDFILIPIGELQSGSTTFLRSGGCYHGSVDIEVSGSLRFPTPVFFLVASGDLLINCQRIESEKISSLVDNDKGTERQRIYPVDGGLQKLPVQNTKPVTTVPIVRYIHQSFGRIGLTVRASSFGIPTLRGGVHIISILWSTSDREEQRSAVGPTAMCIIPHRLFLYPTTSYGHAVETQ